VGELAILGGEPAFKEKVYAARPYIADLADFRKYLDDIFESRFLTNAGKYVRELEKRIADMHGVKHCIAACNGTIALQMAINALGLAGEVICPSFTFIGTAHALMWQGVRPVFCDVEPDTLTIDPARAAELVTPLTTGIIGVHIFGNPCRIQELTDLCRGKRLKLLFDAAHAFAAAYKGKMIGGFGDAEVFSFHATKFFNTFEGGAVLTDNDDLAYQIRMLKNFGFTTYDTVSYLGINGKMCEVAAAFGVATLPQVGARVEKNRLIYECYRRELEGIPGITLQGFNPEAEVNHQYVVIRVESDEYGLSRDRLYELLWKENIMARRYFYPGCHRMEPYRSLMPKAGLHLPVTESICGKVLCLPCFFDLAEDDIATIVRVIRSAHEKREDIADACA